ncbi:MAG: hypothetical protein K2Z81_16325, partial [Cyanobacteria bacterium]|nr:hypothetical protein [Cyanobacteriota bacterium]
MKALLLNEIHLYDDFDVEQDEKTASAVVPSTSLSTVGFSQLTPKLVRELEEGLHNGRKIQERNIALISFLADAGHDGEGHEARALLDTACLPMLVAARLDSLIKHLSRTRDRVSGSLHIELSLPVLAYSYNPDVFFNPGADGDRDFHPVYRNETYFERLRGYDKAFPTCANEALSVSRHLDNVLFWLSKLQGEGEHMSRF